MFHNEGQFFSGQDARRPWRTARNTFVNALQEALNGEQFSDLGRAVQVTYSQTIADALYDNDSDEAIVYVVRDSLSDTTWGRTLDDVFYEGTRYEVSFTIDFSMGAQASDPENPNSTPDADTDLADALKYYIDAYAAAFEAIGLHNIEIAPDAEKQNAGVGRNPHRVSFLLFALPSLNP